MSSQPSAGRHITTLCHTGDCCPEIFELDEYAPADACIRIIDDSGNQAHFGPDTLLLAKLDCRSEVNGNLRLPDSFGDEVYMTRDQHGTLFGPEQLERIFAIAAERGIDMAEVAHLAQRVGIETSIT